MSLPLNWMTGRIGNHIPWSNQYTRISDPQFKTFCCRSIPTDGSASLQTEPKWTMSGARLLAISVSSKSHESMNVWHTSVIIAYGCALVRFSWFDVYDDAVFQRNTVRVLWELSNFLVDRDLSVLAPSSVVRLADCYFTAIGLRRLLVKRKKQQLQESQRHVIGNKQTERTHLLSPSTGILEKSQTQIKENWGENHATAPQLFSTTSNWQDNTLRIWGYGLMKHCFEWPPRETSESLHRDIFSRNNTFKLLKRWNEALDGQKKTF